MVYEKSLVLSTYATTGGDMTTGQITNHMSTDAMNLLYMYQYIHFGWTVPIMVRLKHSAVFQFPRRRAPNGKPDHRQMVGQ